MLLESLVVNVIRLSGLVLAPVELSPGLPMISLEAGLSLERHDTSRCN